MSRLEPRASRPGPGPVPRTGPRAGLRTRQAAEAAPAGPAPIFAALGDATRLELVSRLSDGRPRSITHLTGGLELTRQGVSKHLRVLEQAGLVGSIRVGRESQYAFKPEAIGAVRSYLDAISVQWDDALSRLKTFVEADLVRNSNPSKARGKRSQGRK